MKKIVSLLVTAAMGVGLAACSGGTAADNGKGTIWYSTKNSTEQVHVAFANGVEAEAQALGFNADTVVAEADAAKQNDQLNNLIMNMNPAAIVVNPYDSDSVADVLNRARDKGIPIAVIDNKANNVEVDLSVLFDSYASGVAAGEKAVELLTERYGEPKGVVVNLFGEVVSQVFKDRAAGFEDTIKKYPNITLKSALGAPEADVATSTLNNILADAKASGEKIDLVNTPTDTATLGVIESLKTNGLWLKSDDPNHVMVISHDGLGDILDQVEEGYVDAEVVIDVFGVGGIAVEVLNEYPMQDKAVPSSGTFTPKGKYLNKEVTFEQGDNGPTIMLDPVVVDAETAADPLIWGNAEAE